MAYGFKPEISLSNGKIKELAYAKSSSAYASCQFNVFLSVVQESTPTTILKFVEKIEPDQKPWFTINIFSAILDYYYATDDGVNWHKCEWTTAAGSPRNSFVEVQHEVGADSLIEMLDTIMRTVSI